MGSGASAGVAAAVEKASDDELKNILSALSGESQSKLKAALGGAAAAPASGKKALIVCTSSDKMNDHPTGLWSEEACGPYYVFQDAGWSVTLCSIAGGDVPIDVNSRGPNFLTENDKRMDKEEKSPLKNTPKLADQDVTSFDVVFFSGGHGTCVDFPTDEVGAVVSKVLDAGKVLAAVCHGPMALVNAKTKDGEPVVKGKKVTVFTEAEEGPNGVNLAEKVPFSLSGKMAELGATVETSDPWTSKATRDGNLVTGQNPQSSVEVAKLCLG